MIESHTHAYTQHGVCTITHIHHNIAINPCITFTQPPPPPPPTPYLYLPTYLPTYLHTYLPPTIPIIERKARESVCAHYMHCDFIVLLCI